MAKPKGLILAAGYGSRMRPITDQVPKPLVPFLGKPLIQYAIDRMVEAGISDFAVNTHHLHRPLEAYLKKNLPGCRVSYEKSILGTGGATTPLRSWLRDSDLLIYNADIISDISVTGLIDQHYSGASPPLATLALLKNPDTTKTPLGVGQGGKISAIGHVPKNDSMHSFTGIHLASRQLLSRIPEGFSSIIDPYKEAIAKGEPIQAFVTDGFWRDLGTPSDFYQAHHDALLKYAEELKKVATLNKGCHGDDSFRVVGHESQVDSSARLHGDVFIFGNTTIAPRASITNSVIIDSNIEPDACLDRVIMYKQTTIHLGRD